jgi:outer membrane usher protein
MRALTIRRHALALGLGVAITLPAHALPGDETLLLDVCINDRCVGVAAVIARGDDVLVDRAALDAAGLDVTGTTPEHLGERDFISLHQLNHGSTFAIDRSLLRLDMKLRADRLPRQRVSMATREQAEAGLQPWSAFLNYAVGVGGARTDRNVYLDGAIGRGNAALRSSAAWDEDHGGQRGLTRFEYDQPSALRRWTVGDQVATARDPLAGGRLIGGVGVERAFDTDPYLVTFPQPYYSGVLESPGTVEVYANGTLIGRRELAAGPFTLEQLGIQPGRNDVRVIVSDPFGNRSELASRNYYGGTPRLLAKGLSEYAVRIGAPRTGGGLGGDYVHSTAYQGWYRRGVSDAITLGGRIEGDEWVRNAGVDAAVTTPLGEFALAWAQSDTDRLGRASAHAVNYSLGTRWLSFGLGMRRADAGYRNLNDPAATVFGTLRVDDYASISVSPAGGFSLQVNAGRQRRDGFATERTYGATGSLQLWSGAQLFMGAQRIESVLFRNTTVQLSLNIALQRDSFNITARHNDTDGNTSSGYGIDARRSRPTGTGFGYAASLQRDGDIDRGFGQVEYQGAHGRVLLEADVQGGNTTTHAFASGALVAIGGRMFVTPPVESGFALVRVPGLANVPILRENQVVGRTDAHGDLLVRELLPFQSNRVALDESAVPAAWSLSVPRRDVQVARNTGSVVLLQGNVVHAITGHFRYAGAAAGDDVVVGDGEASPMGSDGLFYIEGIDAGQHTARIDSAAGAFTCTVDVPADAGTGIIDLGEVACGAAQ